MIKSKIKIAAVCLMVLAGTFLPAAALAVAPVSPTGVPTSGGGGGSGSQSTPTGAQVQSQLNKNPIVNDINTIVTFLSAVVGVVIVGNLIAGGIEYSTAGGNAQRVSEARKRIMNTFLALFAFLLLWAFANWLIPGGVFG